MDSKKFDQMVREFPFIKQVIANLPSFTGSVNDVSVKRGDRNLLEVRPGGWHHDADSWGSHSGYRRFWCVSPGELVQLESGQHTTRVPHGTRVNEVTSEIGAQLLKLDRDVQYIVEASDEGWDWEDPNPTITIYKMHDFAWRQSIRPQEEEPCTECGCFECQCEPPIVISESELAEFKRIAAKALARIKQERPRVVVPTYSRRSEAVKEVIQGQNSDCLLAVHPKVVAYVGNVRLSEQHRESIMFGWLTGYSSIPS